MRRYHPLQLSRRRPHSTPSMVAAVLVPEHAISHPGWSVSRSTFHACHSPRRLSAAAELTEWTSRTCRRGPLLGLPGKGWQRGRVRRVCARRTGSRCDDVCGQKKKEGGSAPASACPRVSCGGSGSCTKPASHPVTAPLSPDLASPCIARWRPARQRRTSISTTRPSTVRRCSRDVLF